MAKDLNIPYVECPTIVNHNGFWCQWCCDCGLRHTYFFRVVRGKTPKEDKVEMFIDRDDWATDTLKEIERLKKLIDEAAESDIEGCYEIISKENIT